MFRSATVNISMELWGAVICLIFASFIFIGEDKSSRRSNVLITLLLLMFSILVSDSVAWAFRGDEGTLAFWAVRISNYLVFALNYAIGYYSMLYLEILLEAREVQLSPKFRWPIVADCLLGFMTVTVSQFTHYLYYIDENNLYHRAGGYLVICVVALALLVLMIAATAYYAHKVRMQEAIPLLLVFVLALLATIVQTLFYGVSLVNIGMAVGVVIMFFAYQRERVLTSINRRMQLLEDSMRIAQQETELAKKDAEMLSAHSELVEKQTQIMLSQIQPHFLYNALSAVSFLCIQDPEKAKETIDNFALYLRMNLNSLKNDHLVPFSQELQHTKAYLAIEQTRFGDDLAIEYEIGCEDFELPCLSVQPLAENAVRHGICGREDGGTVTIRTERRDGNIYITVSDNGVGFDPGVKPQDGRIHVGVENVTQRIRTLCGGELLIESAPGAGTKATIVLPEKA